MAKSHYSFKKRQKELKKKKKQEEKRLRKQAKKEEATGNSPEIDAASEIDADFGIENRPSAYGDESQDSDHQDEDS